MIRIQKKVVRVQRYLTPEQRREYYLAIAWDEEKRKTNPGRSAFRGFINRFVRQ